MKGVTKHLGNFDDEADAARAYDKYVCYVVVCMRASNACMCVRYRAARKLHGSEAVLNFPDAGGDDDEPAHTDASDGSDEESDAASDGPPARVAHTTKLRVGKTSAYRGVYWRYVPMRCTAWGRALTRTVTTASSLTSLWPRFTTGRRKILAPLATMSWPYDKCVCLCGAHAGSILMRACMQALRAARKVHGAKAILNFPDDGSPAHAAPPAMRAGAPPLPPTRHVSGIAAAATAKVASLPSRPEKALGGPIKRRAADGATLYDGIKRQRAEEHGAAQAPPAVLMPPLPGLRRIHVATMGGAAPQTLQPSAAVPQQPRFTLTVADLAAPLMWLFRAPATGEVMGPFLISALSRSFQDGDITARDARLLRVWRQGDPEAACMSLEQALELPMIRARSLQLEMLRARHAAPS